MSQQTVVIVDDSPVILEAARLALEPAGFEVATTDNPLSLPHLLRRRAPALVLLDVNMPTLSGDAVAAIVARHGLAAGTLLVLYSDLPEQELAAHVASCGAAGYVRKNLPVAEFVAEVRRWVTLAGEERGVR